MKLHSPWGSRIKPSKSNDPSADDQVAVPINFIPSTSPEMPWATVHRVNDPAAELRGIKSQMTFVACVDI